MSTRIVVLDGGYHSYVYEEGLFANIGYHFEVFAGAYDDWIGKAAFAKGAAGVFVRSTIVNDEFFNALPDVRAVVRYGVGYDNIDLNAATRHGVHVANVQGYANHAVSDHALALMFSCARSIKSGLQHIKMAFGSPPQSEVFEFHDKVLGIIGLGRIGGTLCAKARGLFQCVLAYDPYVAGRRFEVLGAIRTDLSTLLQQSHVISLHCNLTDETRHLINFSAFEHMQQRPVLINTARGPIIETDSLNDALDRQIIHSAGLDVYETEPPEHNYNALLSRPNVLGTGHYAWYSDAASIELQRRAAQNMLAMLRGQIPADCLNPGVHYNDISTSSI
jgi:D-3-phosphoglycerate dehydrogenase / 2-oxoglutarate reductase